MASRGWSSLVQSSSVTVTRPQTLAGEQRSPAIDIALTQPSVSLGVIGIVR